MKGFWSFALPAELKGRYLNTEDAAEYLGLGKSTLEQYRLKGDGPIYRRLGYKMVRYQVDELHEWAAFQLHQNISAHHETCVTYVLPADKKRATVATVTL